METIDRTQAVDDAIRIIGDGLIFTRLIEIKPKDLIGIKIVQKFRHENGWSLWTGGENTYASVLGVGIFLVEV